MTNLDQFRKLCALLEESYDTGNMVESDKLTIVCYMQSGFRNERTVRAELQWKDRRDEALDLGVAVDEAYEQVIKLRSHEVSS